VCSLNLLLKKAGEFKIVSERRILSPLPQYSMDEISKSPSVISTPAKKKPKTSSTYAYMMVLDGLPKSKHGYFRLLETNNKVILPTNTDIRLLVSAA
jgi:hypothetical protein